MQRITQNAQTSSVPCQLSASKVAAIDACAGKHRAPHAHLCSRDDHPVLSVRATAESMG